MKLVHFSGKNINDFMNFDFDFHERICFITGINGSGKTTVLNCIVALISPNLQILSRINFASISLRLEYEGEEIEISATQKNDECSIGIKGLGDRFVFPRYLNDVDDARSEETEAVFFREILTAASQNKSIKKISDLPTPMFLGLDRRAQLISDDQRRRYWSPIRGRRVGRNIFGASIAESLIEAAIIAENYFRDALISSGKIAEDLQKEMLLNLLTSQTTEFLRISIPTPKERREMAKIREHLAQLPHIFNIPHADIEKKISPFLDKMEKIISNIPASTKLRDLGRLHKEDNQLFQTIVAWAQNKSALEKINIISSVVSKFNEQRQKQLEPVDKYLKLINKFLQDSGKAIIFDERGHIFVKIKGITLPRPIMSLSSGEAQIFVILTHLAFNARAQAANVFIIDEPELSLHLKWQELFVDSVIAANDAIQFILATHSPAIIMERIDCCVDMNNMAASS